MTTDRLQAHPTDRPLTLRVLNRAVNPLLLGLLASPAHRLLSRKVLVLKYDGRLTGRRVVIPVTYAQDGETRLIVVAGHPTEKTWWHNFDHEPRPVVVRVRGRKMQGTAHVLEPDHIDRLDAMCVYTEEFPKAHVSPDDPVIVVTLSERLPMLT